MSPTKTAPAKTRADEADRHELYQKSVQEPEADVSFFNRIFKKVFRRRAHILREDFCGTGWLACTWAADHKKNVSYGYDLDPDPLRWGELNNLPDIDEEPRERVHLLRGNVLDVTGPKADIVAGLNFSYFCFKTRAELLVYLKAAYENLGPEGLLVLDIEGGPDTHGEGEDTRKVENFTYVWTQEEYDPITHHAICSIGFRFRDGSSMPHAFTYDWRIWTVPELRDLLVEAGFERADVYWEGTDPKTGDGDGEFKLTEHAEQFDAWIAYIVGVKREKKSAGKLAKSGKAAKKGGRKKS